MHDRVYAIHLACKETIDEKVIGVLKRKMKLVEAVIGKRIKGEDDSGLDIDAKNDISDLFKMMQDDAKKRLKR
jgi:SNF2 family DNA or RNA helicase